MQSRPADVPLVAAFLRPSIILLSLWLLGLAPGVAPAQEAETTKKDSKSPAVEEPTDEEPPAEVPPVREVLVVSANRLEVPAFAVGSTLSLIDREEIERRDPLSVSDLLRTVPGVEVTRNGGLGAVTSVRLRGGDASQALVLVDGVRANSTTTGDFDFAHLTVDNLERIEILRGPQATYGSEAVSGVISIVTRKGGDGFNGRLAAELGSDDLEHYRASAEGGRGAFDFSLALSDLATSGISLASERVGNTEPDRYDNRTLSGRFGYAFRDDGRLDLSLRQSDGDNEVDGFFGDDLNALQFTASNQAALTLSKRLAPFWTQTVRLGVTENDLVGEDPDTEFNNFRADARVSMLNLQSDVTLAPENTLSFGYEAERREADNVGLYDETVDVHSGFVQNAWSHDDRLHLTGAVRHDDHSQFGSETTYRLTAALLFAGGDRRLRTSFGTGFRAPDFNELYFPFAGDPTLQAETSEGFDIGFEQALFAGRLRFDVTYFDLEVENLIDFDLVTFRFGNVASATSEGIEAALQGRLGRSTSITLTHTYNDTEDRSTGAVLARRPRNRSTLLLSVEPIDWLQAVLAGYAVSDRVDSNGLPMEDYERFDLTLQGRLGGRFQPYVRLENFFDEDYEEVPGFTSPGRIAAVGLAMDF